MVRSSHSPYRYYFHFQPHEMDYHHWQRLHQDQDQDQDQARQYHLDHRHQWVAWAYRAYWDDDHTSFDDVAVDLLDLHDMERACGVDIGWHG